MSFLSELQEQALVVSTILNTFNPLTMHFNGSNYVIFGNHNHKDFQAPEKHKKYFGNQSILTAIAKVNGYNTYKSLLEDPKPKLARDSMFKALELLNPYPLSKFNTQAWLKCIRSILESFEHTPPLKPHTYQNFKKHDEAPYLNFVNYGIHHSYTLDLFCSLMPIAESIYLTALKQPFVRIVRDSYVPSKNGIMDKLLLDIHTKGFKTEPFLLKDCLIQPNWDDRSIKTFIEPLKNLLASVFHATLSISGNSRKPLDMQFIITFEDLYNAVKSNRQLDTIYTTKEILANLQQAAQELKKEIGVDDVIYTHPNFMTIPAEEFEYNLELNHKLKNSLNLKKSNSNTYQQDPFIKGSKLYWINIAPSLFAYPLVEKHLSKTYLSKDQIKAFIKTEVLDKLTPVPKVLSFDDKFQYHFRVKQEFIPEISEFRYKSLNIPEYITVFSNYSISEEVALLMVHAEIYRLTNADEKYYGQPNQVISFSSSSYDLSPKNLSNPAQYEDLTKIKISRLKKPNPNYSYIIKFHPEAIIKSINVNEFHNEDFPEIDINDDLWLQIDLIDCLSKKGLSNEEMGVHTILFQSNPLNHKDRENIPAKMTTELTRAQVKELNIEEELINQPFMKEIINKFIEDTILSLSMNNDLRENLSSPYQAISYPFAEHYVKNKPYLGDRAVSVDIV